MSDESLPSSPQEQSVSESTKQQLPTTDHEIKHKDIVAMQRLAKKRKLFLIQKLTKRIKMLKNKKGNDLQLQKNQRKVERLYQKINDLKEIDFCSVISELVGRNFVVPDLSNSADETTKEWFMFELTQDKASFMSFVNSLNEEAEPEIFDNLDRKRKRNEPPVGSEKSIDSFTSRLSSYSEKDDVVLNNILKPRKNRPGQRARQKEWEEMYGEKAKHLNKLDSSKQDKSARENKSKNQKNKELAPQEIIKKLKEKDKLSKTTVEIGEHPSWLAKKQQAALSSKIDVFAGTKTTFSDDD